MSIAKILRHKALQGFYIDLRIIPVSRAVIRPLGKVGLQRNVMPSRLLDDLTSMGEGYEFVIRSMNKQDRRYVKIARFSQACAPSFHAASRVRD